jgi:ribosomal protein S18 acetylase RimI-like enzyme
MTLRIRDGREEDAEAVEAVHYESREAVYRDRVAQWPPQGPDRPGRVARWQAWLSDPTIDSIVGEVDGEIVGFCTVRPSEDEGVDPEVVAEMPTLYVRPDLWHRGYGRALCTEALTRASARGFRSLTLWVLEMNLHARRFYGAVGFTREEVTKADEDLVARRYRIALR